MVSHIDEDIIEAVYQDILSAIENGTTFIKPDITKNSLREILGKIIDQEDVDDDGEKVINFGDDSAVQTKISNIFINFGKIRADLPDHIIDTAALFAADSPLVSVAIAYRFALRVQNYCSVELDKAHEITTLSIIYLSKRTKKIDNQRIIDECRKNSELINDGNLAKILDDLEEMKIIELVSGYWYLTEKYILNDKTNN